MHDAWFFSYLTSFHGPCPAAPIKYLDDHIVAKIGQVTCTTRKTSQHFVEFSWISVSDHSMSPALTLGSKVIAKTVWTFSKEKSGSYQPTAGHHQVLPWLYRSLQRRLRPESLVPVYLGLGGGICHGFSLHDDLRHCVWHDSFCCLARGKRHNFIHNWKGWIMHWHEVWQLSWEDRNGGPLQVEGRLPHPSLSLWRLPWGLHCAEDSGRERWDTYHLFQSLRLRGNGRWLHWIGLFGQAQEGDACWIRVFESGAPCNWSYRSTTYLVFYSYWFVSGLCDIFCCCVVITPNQNRRCRLAAGWLGNIII